MKKRSKIRNWIIFISSVIIVAVFVFLVFHFGLFKFQASEQSPATYVTSQATMTYQDSSGGAYTESSNLLKIRKVTLFPVTMNFQGKSSALKGEAATVTFTERVAPYSTSDPILFSYDYATGIWSSPDWTTLPSLDVDKAYDLTISSPGYLSREIPNQVLANTSGVTVLPLLAGNLDNNNVINYNDYTTWNDKYGQDAPAGSALAAYDYNGDGVINYKDFAIAFGSSNYNKTVNAQ
jgi:hypothetical protein